MNNQGFIINEENRAHVSLSYEAIRMIEADMVNFRFDTTKKNKSGFFNLIFRNYYEEFPLSPKVVLKNIKKIQSGLKSDGIEKRIITDIITEFSKDFMVDSIQEYAGKYRDDFKFKIKLNKENAEIIKSYPQASYFEEFAPRSGMGFFLKIIFESYARLSKIQREKVIFRDKINLIESCIAKGKKVRIIDGIEQTDGKPMFINDHNRHNTLKLFYSMDQEDGISVDEADLIKVEVRETNISSEYSDHAKLIEEQFGEKIREEMIEHTNQYSILPKTQVKVRFTSLGLERYLRQEDAFSIKGIEMETNSSVLIFDATESEIFYSLFQFGGQAQVIEPLSLREKMKAMYQAACLAYQSEDTHDETKIL